MKALSMQREAEGAGDFMGLLDSMGYEASPTIDCPSVEGSVAPSRLTKRLAGSLAAGFN
jgi:hypothetical protein